MASDPFKVTGIESTTRMLQGLVDRLRDPSGAQRPVDKALNAAYRARFDSWHGYLVDTGRLRASFTDDGATGAVRRVGHDSVEFGSDVPYARFHSGSLLRITPAMTDAMAEVLAEYAVSEGDRDPMARHR
jgi:hypothetical protein